MDSGAGAGVTHSKKRAGKTASRLRITAAGGPMSERFCSLIVLAPGAPRTFQLHLSRGATAILVVAFLLSFLAMILIGHTVPGPVNEVHRAQLETENRTLRVEASNAAIGIDRLNAKLSELEA